MPTTGVFHSSSQNSNSYGNEVCQGSVKFSRYRSIDSPVCHSFIYGEAAWSHY